MSTCSREVGAFLKILASPNHARVDIISLVKQLFKVVSTNVRERTRLVDEGRADKEARVLGVIKSWWFLFCYLKLMRLVLKHRSP